MKGVGGSERRARIARGTIDTGKRARKREAERSERDRTVKGKSRAIHQGDTRVWGDVSEDRLTSAPDTIKSLLNIPT